MRTIIALCAFAAGSVTAQPKTTYEAATEAGERNMVLLYQCVPKDGRPYWRDRPCAEAPDDLIHVNKAWAPKNATLCEQLEYIYRQRRNAPILIPIN
ncbi:MULTISPECIES: hypothetical protein [unclassified Comamonas]|uniref:hypothetical protein n=1 Tax=unclassified Comamonas TaxID=2638500 RepID=UPI001EFB73E5|nr:hypothetical protein [Comamonas sp. B21-038]ULR90842.1 hypothetical protein MJ205_08355 [Comamonas sp. B21-038]